MDIARLQKDIITNFNKLKKYVGGYKKSPLILIQKVSNIICGHFHN